MIYFEKARQNYLKLETRCKIKIFIYQLICAGLILSPFLIFWLLSHFECKQYNSLVTFFASLLSFFNIFVGLNIPIIVLLACVDRKHISFVTACRKAFSVSSLCNLLGLVLTAMSVLLFFVGRFDICGYFSLTLFYAFDKKWIQLLHIK